MTNTNGDRDNDLEAVKQILFTVAGNMRHLKGECLLPMRGLTGWRKGKTAHKTS